MQPDTLESQLEEARKEMIFRTEQVFWVYRYPPAQEKVAQQAKDATAHYLALVAELNDRNAAEARLRELTNA